jgi:RsiW-degrading membrane proteinase PrsW (M82 family)
MILGISILVFIFAVIFYFVHKDLGVKETIIVLAGSFALSALVVLAAFSMAGKL